MKFTVLRSFDGSHVQLGQVFGVECDKGFFVYSEIRRGDKLVIGTFHFGNETVGPEAAYNTEIDADPLEWTGKDLEVTGKIYCGGLEELSGDKYALLDDRPQLNECINSVEEKVSELSKLRALKTAESEGKVVSFQEFLSRRQKS